MDQLPPELLSLIYTLVLPIPPCTSNFRIEYPSETRYEALTGLRLVSRRWNDIVVDTPELWSYLQLSQDRLNPPLNLERSKAAPLHVRIHFQMVKRDPSFADKLKRLWATTDRWKTYVGVAWVAFWGLRLLPARPLPTMEELWLIGLVGLAKITIDAPRLTTLVQNFDNVTPGATGFPNLKVWRTPFRAHRFEWDRFMMVVDACPHLERLELSNPHKGWSMDQLPLELISLIYTILLPIPACSDEFDEESAPVTRAEDITNLRLVSKMWNDTVLDTPELWSYIHLFESGPPLRLERSKAAPLHIRISFESGEKSQRFLEGVKALWRVADRWITYLVIGDRDGSPLLPVCPLPNIQELWLMPYTNIGLITIDAPRLKKLVQITGNATIGPIGCTNLTRWGTTPRIDRAGWERFMTVVSGCPLLETVELIGQSILDVDEDDDEEVEWTMASTGFTDLADHFTLPAVRVLVLWSQVCTSDLTAYLKAPHLEEIMIRHSGKFGPFSVPSASSCPSLSRIRFVNWGDMEVIRPWLESIPDEVITRINVEIESSEDILLETDLDAVELLNAAVRQRFGDAWAIKWARVPRYGSSYNIWAVGTSSSPLVYVHLTSSIADNRRSARTEEFEEESPLLNRSDDLTKLRLVSKRWNDTVLDTPELWSYIRLLEYSPPLHLERSKAAPLHIRITFGSGLRSQHFLEGMQAIWSVADRWKTYVGIGGGRDDPPLMPACPLPNIQELWLMPYSNASLITIDAPRLKKFVQTSDNATLGPIGCPNLTYWCTAPRIDRAGWERFMTVVMQCLLLEHIELTGQSSLDADEDEEVGWTMASTGFTDLGDHFTLSGVKVLVLWSQICTSDFTAYLRGPYLEEIGIRLNQAFAPFPVPSASSCPSLSRIRFFHWGNIEIIRPWLESIPDEVITRITVEIESSEAILLETDRDAVEILNATEIDDRPERWLS
ncbi:hypothetical protein FRB90_003867 [Tulasnella sp. 427]|nr:hypothetical protein FRB90_003867 [Tulasnella sp. 427]